MGYAVCSVRTWKLWHERLTECPDLDADIRTENTRSRDC